MKSTFHVIQFIVVLLISQSWGKYQESISEYEQIFIPEIPEVFLINLGITKPLFAVVLYQFW